MQDCWCCKLFRCTDALGRSFARAHTVHLCAAGNQLSDYSRASKDISFPLRCCIVPKILLENKIYKKR